MAIKPLGDRVLVQPLEQEGVTKGGIVLPDSAKEKSQKGKVVAIGTGKVTDDGKTLPLDVKEGDTVLYGKYAGSEITENDVDYIVMREDEILAIIN